MSKNIRELYFEDLNQQAQEKVLEFYNISTPEEGNLDIIPLVVLEKNDSN